ncbi:6-O-methylguanine DNA methyltransferase [Coprinopsis sp. MPI-PUGE-AT-0042]|nr:6-O-methylguanine DNA methyltransferase [Coprinopsis sp. MPI-PUGE-AT-0042]
MDPSTLSRYRYKPYDKQEKKASDASSCAAELTYVSPQSVTEEALSSQDSGQMTIQYPVGHKARKECVSPSGKPLSEYQWKVYDYLLTIPEGKVATYQTVVNAVGGSARAAGTACKKNPFSPYVPCHRVIASNMNLGGFFGQKFVKGMSHPNLERKRAHLKAEGVEFDENGRLLNRSHLLG